MAHELPYVFGTEFLCKSLQPLCSGVVGDTRERVFESFESYVHLWCLVKQVLHQGDSESKVLAFV